MPPIIQPIEDENIAAPIITSKALLPPIFHEKFSVGKCFAVKIENIQINTDIINIFAAMINLPITRHSTRWRIAVSFPVGRVAPLVNSHVIILSHLRALPQSHISIKGCIVRYLCYFLAV
jgi:hypothetical protein